MNREQIEQAAIQSAKEACENFEEAFEYSNGFVYGAVWRINSVWHEVKNELPECNRHVVNEDWLDFIAKDRKDLMRILKEYSFDYWAYVEDLLPTKGGEE